MVIKYFQHKNKGKFMQVQNSTVKNARFQSSRYNHVYWADIKGQGLMQEVVVVAHNPNGSVWFIPVESLDNIDRQRMFRLITDRTAQMLPLYEIMAHVRLNNGINALEYFQQLVKFMTPTGAVIAGNTNMIASAPTIPVQTSA